MRGMFRLGPRVNLSALAIARYVTRAAKASHGFNFPVRHKYAPQGYLLPVFQSQFVLIFLDKFYQLHASHKF